MFAYLLEGRKMNSQLEKNRAVYNAIKDEMEAEHFGRAALLHDGEVVEIYNDSGDAYAIGCEKFGLGNFSIENIGEPPISLGVFTMCLPKS